MDRLYARMKQTAPRIDGTLNKLLPRAELAPEVLHDAMRYAVLGGGKRIRALLCLFGAEICGGKEEEALPAACALECVHAYSLIHDDLPAMDDGEMRRGKLATHRAFGEAVGILAGDALLTLAFEILARSYPPDRAAPAVLELARAAGHRGMVGGQMLDLEGEEAELDFDRIAAIDRWKTGALLAASCRIGARVAGGNEETLEALAAYGRHLGLVFQIVDDLLDIESDAETLGKPTGRDAAVAKSTYPAALGAEKARELAQAEALEAKNAIKGFGKEALMLRLLADFLLVRKK